MKILVVSNLYPPDFLGGYELGCRQVVNALSARGHDVRVLTANPRGPVADPPGVERRLRLADVYDSYTHQRLTLPTLAGKQLDAHVVQASNVHALTECLAEFRPDVVYFWNVVGLGGIGLMATAQHLGYPWVMHVMDAVPMILCTVPFAVRPEVGSAFARMLDGRYLCCSRTVLNEIVASGVPIGDQSVVVPNWIDTAGEPDRTEYMPGGHLRIVQAGALAPQKGVLVVTRAAGILRDRGHRNFSIDFFGPGDDTPFRTLVHELDLADRVRFRGVRTQAELAAMYGSYDVFTFPTWEREPFGFAPMEAAAHGCLPIVTETCGYSEWMIDGVDCLKSPRTPEGFADAIERVLLGEVDLNALARRGMANVLRYFSLSAILPRIEAELAAEIARPRRAPAGTAADAYRMALLAEKTFQVMAQEAFAA